MRKNNEMLPLTLRTALIVLLFLLLSPAKGSNLAVTLFNINCREKTKGISGGKICDIHENTFVLKAVDQPREALFRPNMENAYKNMRLFRTFDVKTPNVFFMENIGESYTIDGKLYRSDRYLASQFIPTFREANTLKKETSREFHKSCRNKLFEKFVTRENFFRRSLLGKIGGESGLAQLAVSSTICDDIAPNGANWGSDGKNLVIIDADLSPESFEGYLQLALKMPIEIDISFTSKTIEEMIKIYTALLGKIERNEIDPFPNLTALETNSFITFMQTACQNTIERISINPSFSINEILFQEIDQQRTEYFVSNAMK